MDENLDKDQWLTSTTIEQTIDDQVDNSQTGHPVEHSIDTHEKPPVDPKAAEIEANGMNAAQKDNADSDKSESGTSDVEANESQAHETNRPSKAALNEGLEPNKAAESDSSDSEGSDMAVAESESDKADKASESDSNEKDLLGKEIVPSPTIESIDTGKDQDVSDTSADVHLGASVKEYNDTHSKDDQLSGQGSLFGSDSEEETATSSKRKRLASSDSDEEAIARNRRLDSSSSEHDTDAVPTKMRKRSYSNSSHESDKVEKDSPQSPDAAVTKEGGDDDVIADIFGDSSDEEAEFEGFDEAEIKSAEATESALPEVSSEDELEDDQPSKDSFVSDFDTMMAVKKAERGSGRKKKRNVDIINDNDDLIVDMLKRMREAAEEDRTLNQNHQPATRKLTMLPMVTRQLNKSELQTAFMDCGVLSALTEWLAPLPDKSLPHLSIRQSLLKILSTLPHPHTDQLKSSGIGKAIMYLFKHPKELRSNRDIAGRLINEWSRPIFGQSSNFKSVNREDLQQRDLKTLKNRRKSSTDTKEEEEQRGLRPGDPGWIYRARVPLPSNRDYVVRPESNVDTEVFSKGSTKKKKSRYELQKQKMDNKKKAMKAMTAVKISIEGNKMAL